MTEAIVLPEEATWERLTDQVESSLWYGYFLVFRNMELTRILLGAYRIELKRGGRERKCRKLSSVRFFVCDIYGTSQNGPRALS